MRDQNLSEITYVRLSPEQRSELERIAAANSMTRRLSDHVRFAVEQYIAQHQPELAIAKSQPLQS